MANPEDIAAGTDATPVNVANWDVFRDRINYFGNRVFDVMDYGAVGDGGTDDEPAIDLARIAATASGGLVLFPVGTYKLSTNIAFDADITLMFMPGAKLSIDNGITVTINGPIEDTQHQIFSWTGTGAVTFGNKVNVRPEWFGADNTGANDAYDEFAKAIAGMTSGGTLLGAGASATYKIETNIEVSVSDFTWDGQNCLITATTAGTKWWRFDGEGASDGDWGSALSNCYFRNTRIGAASTDNFLGPYFFWCLDGGIENLTIQGDASTFINVFRSKRIYIRDCNLIQSATGGFGLLLVHCDECLVDNVNCRDGTFIYGMQVKGGYDNIVQNCSITDPGANVATRYGFFDRGDAPWSGASPTNWTRYPWAQYTTTSIAFVDSDPDTITDSNSQFNVQQYEPGSTITVSGSTVNDGTYTIDRVEAGTLTLIAGDTLTAEVEGDTVTLTIDWTHKDGRRASRRTRYVNCSVRGSLDATTLQAFHTQESSGAQFINCSVRHAANGFSFSSAGSGAIESDVLISGCIVEDASSHGMVMNGVDNTDVGKHITIENCIIKESGRAGIWADYMDYLTITNCIIRNSDLTEANQRGIDLDNCDQVQILHNTVYDDQAVPTQQRAFNATNCTNVTLFGNWESGNVVGDTINTDTIINPVTIILDSPELLLHNTTEEDGDGGRESTIRFKGEQSGGELTTLALIKASHDGAADDEKGQLEIFTNDTNDGDTPTLRMTIDATGKITLAAGVLALAETTTPGAVGSVGAIYTKSDNELYFQDGAGVERAVGKSDYAGIYASDNAVATTILLVDAFEPITIFTADMPELISNGVHGTDSITIGNTGVYQIAMHTCAFSAGVNKVYAYFAFEIAASGATITDVTQANPGVVTANAHGFTNGQRVKITGVVGMTELNGQIYTVANKGDNTFELNDDNAANINTGGYVAYDSAGTAFLATRLDQVHIHRKYAVAIDVGAASTAGLASLTLGNTVEAYVKGLTDATNLTLCNCQFYIQRV